MDGIADRALGFCAGGDTKRVLPPNVPGLIVILPHSGNLENVLLIDEPPVWVKDFIATSAFGLIIGALTPAPKLQSIDKAPCSLPKESVHLPISESAFPERVGWLLPATACSIVAAFESHVVLLLS